MTPERLSMEQKVLEEYSPSEFQIEILSESDVLIQCSFKQYKYTLLDFSEFPNKPPKIKVANNTFKEVDSHGDSYAYTDEIIKKNGEFFLDIIDYVAFNPTWSTLKIIRIVNDWLEKQEQQPNGFSILPLA
jgi:ubiquitin-protein ligase